MRRICVALALVVVFLSAASAQTGNKPPFTTKFLSDNQVFRASDVRYYDGSALTGDVVYINLPVRVPVVVTYSIDMFAGAELYFGLKVNDGECTTYGPAAFSSEKNHANTVQWIVSKDEVSFGTNRFEPCVLFGSGSYDLRTLTVMRPR